MCVSGECANIEAERPETETGNGYQIKVAEFQKSYPLACHNIYQMDLMCLLIILIRLNKNTNISCYMATSLMLFIYLESLLSIKKKLDVWVILQRCHFSGFYLN